MEKVEFVPVHSRQQVLALCGMAARIWTEHYTPILGAPQVEYMVEKYQSIAAVERQMQREGYEYYLLMADGQTAGYIGIQCAEGKLFLSKLYIDAPFRGKKLSRRALEFLTSLCKERGLSVIWLTVNRHNASSIAAYDALGFQKAREQVTDIGNGYVMDDFIMEYGVA